MFTSPNRPTVSACLIVKNEAANLPRCLASLRGLVDEIVVVDTGSTDDTVAIAESFGAKIGHFAWCDDFAAARNASLELATGDWVLIIDADETLEVEDVDQWRQLLCNRQFGAYLFNLRNLNGSGQAEISTQVLRLFQRLPGVKFVGRLHESVGPSLRAKNLEAALFHQAKILHSGYREQDLVARDKSRRNTQIARLDVAERPESPKAWLNLARSLALGNEQEEAAQAFAHLTALPGGLNALAQPDYASFVIGFKDTLSALNRWSDVLVLLDQALQRLPNEIFFHFERARARLQVGLIEEALDDFITCLSAPSDAEHILNMGGMTDDLPLAALRLLAERLPETKPRLEAWLLPPVTGGTQAKSQSFLQRLEADPRDAEAFLGLAVQFFEAGALDKALLATSQSIRLQADRAASYHLLGLILEALEQPRLAEKAFRGALALDPDHPTARTAREASRARATTQPSDPTLETEIEILLKRQQPTVSACLIVKNEAANLPRCLASLQGLVDEIVVVDTGSTDDTVAIAESFGAKIGHFASCDDFAAARNASLELATGDWILVIDADETLEISDQEAWLSALRNRRAGAYAVPVQAPEPAPSLRIRVLLREASPRFEGARFESTLDSLLVGGWHCAALTGTLIRGGAKATGKQLNRFHAERQLQALLGVVESRPQDPHAWYDLAEASSRLENAEIHAQAFDQIDLLLSQGAPLAESSFCAYTLQRYESLQRANRPTEALELLERGLKRVPGFPEFLYARGQWHQQHGNFSAARADYEACLSAKGKFFLARLRAEVTDTWPRAALASLPDEANTSRPPSASAPFDECLALGSAHLQSGRWAAAAPLLAQAVSTTPEDEEIRFKWGWALFKLAQYDDAISALLPLAHSPRAQELLGRAYLEAGQGPRAQAYLAACPLPSVGLMLGWAHFLQDKPADALIAWEQWLKAGAADWGTKDALASFLFLMQGGERPSGVPEHPAEPLRHMAGWFQLLLRYDRLDEVEHIVQRGPLLGDHLWPSLRLLFAEKLVLEKWTDLAARLLNEAAQETPHEPDVLFLLGKVACLRGLKDEAAEHLSTCPARSPLPEAAKEGPALSPETSSSAAENEAETRIDWWQRLEETPRQAAAYLGMAHQLFEEGSLDKALLAVSQAIRLDANSATTYHLLGLILAGVGQASLAERAFVAALLLDPDHAAALASRQACRAKADPRAIDAPLQVEVERLLQLQRPTVSACLIVKDEAANLPRCLASLQGLVDEIVVVDTGSTDDTVAIAESFGAKIGHFAWCDDFAAARNASLELATGDWILVIDADEALEVEDLAYWHSLLRYREFGGYNLLVRNLTPEGRVEFEAPVTRLLQRLPGIRFSGRLHETVGEFLTDNALNVASVRSIHLLHTGYQAEALRKKHDRNLHIATLNVKAQPDNPQAWLHLARSQNVPEEATVTYAHLAAQPGALNRLSPSDFAAYILGYKNALAALERQEDLRLLLDQGLARLPNEPCLRFERGRLRAESGESEGAFADFVACLGAVPQVDHFITLPGLTDELPRAALLQLAAQHPSLQAHVEAHLRSFDTQSRPSLSACLIVKDEAANLPRCLASLQGLVDEIVVVDTGSTDDTLAIAESFGAKIGHFAWCDDFAAARNASLELATGDWALVIDADETLEVDVPEAWFAQLRNPSVGGYALTLQNVDREGRVEYETRLLRLVRRLPGLRFTGRLHETLEPALNQLGAPTELCALEARLLHTGHQPEVVAARGKGARNLHLAELATQADPDNAEAWFNLAHSQASLQDYVGALASFSRLENLAGEFEQLNPWLWVACIQTKQQVHQRLGQLTEALQTLERGLERLPNEVTLRYERGLLRSLLGDVEGALLDLTACLQGKSEAYTATSHPGVTDVLPTQALRELAAAHPNRRAEILAHLPSGSEEQEADAIELLFARLEHNPQDAEAYWELAFRFFQRGETDKALLACCQSLRLDARRDAGFHLLGLILDALGQAALAAQAFTTVLQLNPDHPQARSCRRNSLTEAIDQPSSPAELAAEIKHLLGLLIAPQASPQVHSPHPSRLSACLIVKNEAANLPRCLASLQGLVDEIVVVDTGSTDDTLAIAESFGAKIGHFAWCDDFAAARNASLELATGDWILVIDADETLEVDAPAEWRTRLAKSEHDVLNLQVHNLNDDTTVASRFSASRLLRRQSGLRFRGRLHEELSPARPSADLTGVALKHYGYAARALNELNKQERNLRLAEANVKEEPDSPEAWYHLARTQWLQRDATASRASLQRIDELAQTGRCLDAGRLRSAALLAAWVDEALEGPATAEMRLEAAIRQFPDYAELHFERGRLLSSRQAWEEAGYCFETCLQLAAQPIVAPLRQGVTGFLAHAELAAIALQTKHWESARRHFQLAAADPHCPAAEAAHLNTVLTQLGHQVEKPQETKPLEAAERCIERGQWKAARQLLLSHLESSPRDNNAFRLLAQCFMQEQALDKALLAISQAIELHAGQDDNYYLFGLLLNELGQPQLANRAFKLARHLNPDHPTALEAELATRNHPAKHTLDEAQHALFEHLFQRARPTVSACLIVKDEAENLPRCLASLQGLVDEIVVVDTGSTDDTVAIAESFGAKVGHFAWCDDFAAARNASLELATGDWVLVIDADEALEVEDVAYWHSLLRYREFGGYAIQQRNLQPTGTIDMDAQVLRLFQHLTGIRFSGRLHETVAASLEAQNLHVVATEHIHLLHTGYQAEPLIKKRQRNVQLATLGVQEHPADPKAWLNLARSLNLGEKPDEAVACFSHLAAMPGALEALSPANYAAFILGYKEALVSLHRYSEALAVLDSGIRRLPNEVFFRLERGYIRMSLGDGEGALSDFITCLSTAPNAYNFISVPGLTNELPQAALRQLAERIPFLKPKVDALHLQSTVKSQDEGNRPS